MGWTPQSLSPSSFATLPQPSGGAFAHAMMETQHEQHRSRRNLAGNHARRSQAAPAGAAFAENFRVDGRAGDCGDPRGASETGEGIMIDGDISDEELERRMADKLFGGSAKS